MPPNAHPDAIVAAKLARDLDGAFDAFLKAYQERVFRFAMRYCGNPHDGQEIAQDAFVRAYRALQTYDTARIRSMALGPWLYRIALNVARNRVRGKRLTLAPLDEARDYSLERRYQPDERTSAHETSSELAALIAQLPARYRAPVVLRYIEDLPYAEIAEVLDAPIGTVKANVHRGIALLRKHAMESQGVLV